LGLDFARVLKLDPKMATSVKMELEKVKKEEEAEVLKKNKGKKVGWNFLRIYTSFLSLAS